PSAPKTPRRRRLRRERDVRSDPAAPRVAAAARRAADGGALGEPPAAVDGGVALAGHPQAADLVLSALEDRDVLPDLRGLGGGHVELLRNGLRFLGGDLQLHEGA